MLILVLIFFLCCFFFVNCTAFSLGKLGEVRSGEAFIRHHEKELYSPFHKWLFKEYRFDYLILGFRLVAFLALVGYAITSVFLIRDVISVLHVAWIIVLIIILLFLLFGLGFLFPFLIRGEKSLNFSSSFSSLLLYFTLPFSFPLLKLSEWIGRKMKRGEDEENLEEMKDTIVALLQKTNVKGRLNPLEKKLIESVLMFKDRIVREVMMPRVDVFSLPVNMKIREAAEHIVREGYSRIPVYRDSVDNVIGILMFKEVLEFYMDCDLGKRNQSFLDQPIETIIKRAFYTPETKKVSHLLQEFRAKKVHMAIVVDEYGGTEGVVTLEDLLEEIVGDIADEYDVGEETLYTPEPSGESWIVDARMSILDAEVAFGIRIPQLGDYDTIGGYIFEQKGSLPKTGEKISHEEFDIEVLQSTDRNIEKVKITKKKPTIWPL